MNLRCASSDNEQLENYLRSHADDSCKLLGVPLGTPLRVEIADAGAPIETRRGDREATLRIGSDDAQRVMAYTRSCNWANGIVLVPTLTRLVLAGAFDGLKAGEPRAMHAFAAGHKADPTRNLGLLWGTLNLLALAGWVTLSSDRSSRAWPMRRRCCSTCMRCAIVGA